MSKYTTMLRWIVEQMGQGLPVPEGQRYADAVYRAVGLDEYPIWMESYRSLLNDKIIDHFFFREIGFETAAQFRFYMRRTMNEIMPYYNQMYQSQMLVTDPLSDRDANWSEDHTLARDTESAENTEGSAQTNSKTVFQDTPMSLLDNTSAPTVQGLDYATNVTYNDATSSDERDTNGTVEMDEQGTRNHYEKGRMTSQSELLLKYRKTFVNIDMDVIGELEDLFISLW